MVIAVLVVVVIEISRRGPEPFGIPGHWHLVLDSEFSGNQLPSGWKTGWFGSGVTAPVNTLEDDCYSPHNVTLPGDGTVHLEVTHEASACLGKTRPFTGAIITTNPDDGQGGGFQYTYGVLQARVYLPADGAKLADWPAVWAAGQPGAEHGEQDVIEGIDGVACWHFHTESAESGGCDKKLKPGWHTVAADWRRGYIAFYYDGHKVGAIRSRITSAPMFLLLDNTTTGAATEADAMRVQYVRVWEAS